MNIAEAVESRRSVRGFLPDPVDGTVIRRVIEQAARSPSGCNLQPWRIDVLGGEPLQRLKDIMAKRVVDMPNGEPMEYALLPENLPTPWFSRYSNLAEGMYAAAGIARDDAPARAAWVARNFQFFNAPVGVFCSVAKVMGPPQWSDLGMYLQTLMLLLRGEGLHSCPQECWAIYPQTVREFINIPEDHMLFCGMAIGFEDTQDPSNSYRSPRVALDDFANFHGI